jgi:hexokinase
MSQYKYIKQPDFEKVREDFSVELQAAANGEHSRLLFLKTYLPQQPIITSGELQAIVIGGTNYESAVIAIHDGKSEITFREKGKLHSINTAEDLHIFLDTHLTHKVAGIAINIGFPLNYFQGEKGQPDGTFIKATKEHQLHGLLGHKVGELVLDRYIRKHNAYTIVAVANDVACLAQGDGGVIIGTGYNLGLTGEDETGKYTVNLEGGNSGAFAFSEELEEIEKDTANKGSNQFEKLVSGRYLPLLFNILSKQHGTDSHIAKAEELAEIASQNNDAAGEIARELFDRSAKYIAAHIAGLYHFKDKPQVLNLNVEGSLFLYGYKYQKSLWEGLISHGITKENITFHTDPESSLKGALRLLFC